MRFKPWPNNLGVSAKVKGGQWDVFLAEFGRPCAASFYPSDGSKAIKHGEGPDPQTAVKNAKPVKED